MTTLSIPSSGLTLHDYPGTNDHDDASKTEGKFQQAMRLDLDESVLQNILRSARSGGKGVHISCGKNITLHFGNRSKQLTADIQSTPTELYTYDPETNDELRFAALQSHRLAMKQAQDSTVGADAALTKLQMSLATVEKEKLSKQTQLADAHAPSKRDAAHSSKTLALKQTQSQRLSSGSARHSSGKTSLGAASAPHTATAPTSAPPIDDHAKKARAIRLPLIHFLAVRPVSEKYLAQTIRCSTGECKDVLERVGRQYRLDASKWDLTDRAYRELDVYRFDYPSQEDRQLAIDRAVTAYDRLRLPPGDALWQRLLPVHERGRGKVLSKLNLREAPKGQKAMTPRINVQATNDARVGGATPNDSDTRPDRLAPSDAESMARSKSSESTKKSRASDKAVKKSPLTGPIHPSKVQKPKEKAPTRVAADAKKGTKKGPPTNVIAKSSEFVHDSDEEADEYMTDASAFAAVSKTPTTAGTGIKCSPALVPSNKPLPQVTSKKVANLERGKDQKKSAPSKVGDIESTKKASPDKVKEIKESKKLTPSKSEEVRPNNKSKTPGGLSTQKRPPTSGSSGSESKYKTPDSTRASASKPKNLQRQRTSSSPLKPSPLGSSPPANASDMDNDDRPSTSASSRSTPLIAQSRSNDQTAPRPRPSAATSGIKAAENTSERSLKRKAEDVDSDMHNHSVSGTNVLTNGLTNGLANGVKRHKASPMSPPTSDSSNSSSSDAKFQQTVEEAQRFKRYYAKYHELYQEVDKLPKDVHHPKFDSLMKMHEKLVKMKEDIAKAAVV